jgi:hypothetical protein
MRRYFEDDFDCSCDNTDCDNCYDQERAWDDEAWCADDDDRCPIYGGQIPFVMDDGKEVIIK